MNAKRIATYLLAALCGIGLGIAPLAISQQGPQFNTSTRTVQSSAIVGTGTNDSAAAGRVGQFITSGTLGPISSTGNGQFFDVGFIDLTAGDWQVFASGTVSSAGATWTRASIGVSTTTGDSGTGLNNGDTLLDSLFASSATTPTAVSHSLAPIRYSVASTTRVYLKALTAQSAGTPTVAGRISARRER